MVSVRQILVQENHCSSSQIVFNASSNISYHFIIVDEPYSFVFKEGKLAFLNLTLQLLLAFVNCWVVTLKLDKEPKNLILSRVCYLRGKVSEHFFYNGNHTNPNKFEIKHVFNFSNGQPAAK